MDPSTFLGSRGLSTFSDSVWIHRVWKIYGWKIDGKLIIHSNVHGKLKIHDRSRGNRKSMEDLWKKCGKSIYVKSMGYMGYMKNRWEKENRKSMDSMGHGKYVGNLWEIIQDGPPPVMFVGL